MNMIRDSLDEMLKADAQMHRDQYIDDAGFTLRTIDALPAPRAGRHVSRAVRIGMPFGLALLATLFVTFFAGGKNFFIDVTMDLATETVTRDVVALALIGAALFVVVLANMVNDK